MTPARLIFDLILAGFLTYMLWAIVEAVREIWKGP